MSYPTFNGWQVIPMPATPGLQSIKFSMFNSVGVTTSPFNLHTRTMLWRGADRWQAEVSLPSMKRDAAESWLTFLALLQGKANVFQLGDPMGANPRGNPSGAPVCDTAGGLLNNSAMAYVLYTRGWTANRARLLLPGDYLQIGYYLHKVLNVVSSDANGKAQINIFPSLREQPADGSALVLNKARGLFRLADNTSSWSVNETRIYSVAFSAIEAR